MALGAIHLPACTGSVESNGAGVSGSGSRDGDGTGTGPDDKALKCDLTAPKTVADTPLRRLTRREYDNTIRHLLGIESAVGASLPADDRTGPFPGNPVAAVSDAHVRLFMNGAESLAAQATEPGSLPKIAPCSADATPAQCGANFIREFGRKVYRRPLSEEQEARLTALFTVGEQAGGYAGGVRLTLQAMLQSPYFLYHVEFKLPEPGEPLIALDSHELAARLSYFLWDSMPDEALLSAADRDELASPDVLRAHAERMLQDDRAAAALESFTTNWLNISGIEELTRDSVRFPGFVPGLTQAMKNETVRFVDHVIRRDDGSLKTLLTARYSFLEGPLFAVYGVEQPFFHDPATPVTLPAERAGVLTHASVLAASSHSDHTSPVKRGVFVLDNVLCHEMEFPEGLDVPDLPDPDRTKTTRERFVQHTSSPACAVCHTIIDPIGFSFERYDPIGTYRVTEAGQAIDDTGTIAIGDPSTDGQVGGAVQLMERFAESDAVRTCMVKQWHRFALARMEEPQDACALDALAAGFDASGRNIRELVLSVVTQDTFRFRPRLAAE
jgi:hypothetical protein